MPLDHPSARRQVPVRLCDVPVDVRLMAAREAMRGEQDPVVCQDLLVAALVPSDHVYFVAGDLSAGCGSVRDVRERGFTTSGDPADRPLGR